MGNEGAGGPEALGFDMKTVWRWVITGFGVVLVAVTAYSFWPYWQSSRAMKTYCERIKPGMTPADVQAAADAFGYSVTPTDGGSVLVQDPVSFGRLQCAIRFDARGVAAAEYSGGF